MIDTLYMPDEVLKKFKPCPFCGSLPDSFPAWDGENENSLHFIVKCPNMGCFNVNGSERELSKLLERWNTRI